MLDALLLSRDDDVIRMFRRISQDLEMALEVCTGVEQARAELSRRFQAVIVDCDDVHCGPELLQFVRNSPANRKSTTFAILNGVTSMRSAFEMGANMTLQKPMALEHVRKSLRTLSAIMEQEHRRYHRVPVDLPVTALFDDQKEFQAIATNISDGGMALRFTHPVPEHRSVSLRFTLPGSTSRIEAKISMAWVDHLLAGVRFEYMPSGSKRELETWVGRNIEGPKKQATPSRSVSVATKSLR